MESETIKKIIISLRDPLNAKKHIQFTQRSIKFLITLFEGKEIGTIDLHCILMRLAHVSGSFQNDQKEHYISLKDIIVYLFMDMPKCITINNITTIANAFDTKKDNDEKEVLDMKLILQSMNE